MITSAFESERRHTLTSVVVLLLKSETLSVPRNAARACLKGGFLGPDIGPPDGFQT